MNDKFQKILGLGEYCYDYIMKVDKDELSNLLGGINLSNSKFIAIDDEKIFRRLVDKCEEKFDIKISSGGTVTNTLYNIAYLNTVNKSNLNLTWKGIKYIRENEFILNPLDNLKRNRCGISFIDCVVDLVPKTLCFIDRLTGETLCIIIPLFSEFHSFNINFDDYEYIIVKYSSLSEEMIESFTSNSQCKVILLLGDDFGVSDFNYKKIIRNANFLRNIRMISCDKIAYKKFGFNLEVVSEYFGKVKFVITNGKKSVQICSDSSNVFYAVDKVESIVSTLGAGDAYIGSFFYYNMMGNDDETSHKLAQKYVSLVLRDLSSQIPPETNLNNIFPAWIQRTSYLDCEGEFFSRIRQSPGTVFISGGQSGVDQIGLGIANDFELPSYAILPKGLRTESKEGLLDQKDDFSRAYILELSSESYRFRTWASAYFSDLSLVWDKKRSEGTIELERACKFLNKPLIHLNDKYEKVVELIFNELKSNDIKVINIAGNRKTFLNAEDEMEILDILNKLVIKIMNFRNEKYTFESDYPKDCLEATKLKIGIVNNRSLRKLLEHFMSDTYNPSFRLNDSIMAFDVSPACSIYFARPREIAKMIKMGIIDLGICGNDILCDTDMVEMIYKTGLSPVYNVIIGREFSSNDTNSILSQYPELNHIVKHNFKEIINVTGSIESYINLGVSNFGLDSWKTGYTANLNGIKLISIIAESSIALFVNKKNKKNMNLILNYIEIFEKWIFGL